MPLTRLVPAEPLPSDGGPLRRRPWLLGTSLLLHVLLVLLALLLARRPEQPGGSPAPSYELLFEPNPGAPAAGQPEPESQTQPAPPPPARSTDQELPGPPTPSPLSKPVPNQPVTPPAPPAPPAPESAPLGPPEPAPPQPVPEAAAPQATPAPEAAAPPLPPTAEPTPDLAAPSPPQITPAAPQVRIEPPTEEEQLPRPTVPQFVAPQPPPPLPPTPPRPRPAPPPPPQAGTFANPMDLNFGPAAPRLAAPRLNAPRGSVASRSLDLSVGMPRQGPPRNDQFADARARAIGADWNRGLLAYWLQHRFYPREAAEAGDDGYVEVELTVNRAGRVIHIDVKTRSGSPFLDMAGLATWRNAQLQPLPREIPGEDYTFSLTLHYILVR